MSLTSQLIHALLAQSKSFVCSVDQLVPREILLPPMQWLHWWLNNLLRPSDQFNITKLSLNLGNYFILIIYIILTVN